jgi:hypothetical protein
LNIRYGASHTELLITPDQSIYFIEVAARMAGDHIGAELVRHSTGYDFVKGVIDVATGRFEPVRKRVDGYAGIYFVTPRAGTVRRIDNRSAGVPEIVKSEILVNIGDKVKYPVMQSNERAAFFIYKKNRGRLDLDPNRIIRVETYDTV